MAKRKVEDGLGIYQLGYMRGVSDLAEIVLNIVSAQQAKEIEERFRRLQAQKKEFRQ